MSDDTADTVDAALLPSEGKLSGVSPLKFPSTLAPLDEPDAIDWGLMWCATPKIDGDRCLIIGGTAYTSSMRKQPNSQLSVALWPLLELSRQLDVWFDLELHNPRAESHAELHGALAARDCPLDGLEAMVFDGGKSVWFEEGSLGMSYGSRRDLVLGLLTRSLSVIRGLPTLHVAFIDGRSPSSWYEITPEDSSLGIAKITFPMAEMIPGPSTARSYYEKALACGYEGAILRSLLVEHGDGRPRGGFYKCGRATVKQQIGFKMKPFETVDGRIIEVIQGTELDPNAMIGVDRSRSPDGSLSRNGLQGNRRTVERVGALQVEWMENGEKRTSKVGFARGFTHADRARMWLDREQLLGQWCEFELMSYGEKAGAGARHGRFKRLRHDKQGELEASGRTA